MQILLLLGNITACSKSQCKKCNLCSQCHTDFILSQSNVVFKSGCPAEADNRTMLDVSLSIIILFLESAAYIK